MPFPTCAGCNRVLAPAYRHFACTECERCFCPSCMDRFCRFCKGAVQEVPPSA